MIESCLKIDGIVVSSAGGIKISPNYVEIVKLIKKKVELPKHIEEAILSLGKDD